MGELDHAEVRIMSIPVFQQPFSQAVPTLRRPTSHCANQQNNESQILNFRVPVHTHPQALYTNRPIRRNLTRKYISRLWCVLCKNLTSILIAVHLKFLTLSLLVSEDIGLSAHTRIHIVRLSLSALFLLTTVSTEHHRNLLQHATVNDRVGLSDVSPYKSCRMLTTRLLEPD